MVSKNIDKSSVKPEPNAEAKKLIEIAKDYLKEGFFELEGIISDSEKTKLEKMNEELHKKGHKAQIIVNEDGKGATILSSTGSITRIGSNNKEMSFSALRERDVLEQWANIFMESKDINDRETVEELDYLMEGVVAVVSDDMKSVVLADANGYRTTVTCNNANKGKVIE